MFYLRLSDWQGSLMPFHQSYPWEREIETLLPKRRTAAGAGEAEVKDALLISSGSRRTIRQGTTVISELGGVDKFEPVSGGGEMDHAEATGQLVVTGDDGAVDLEVAGYVPDAVALLVERPVMLDLHPAV